MDRGFIFVKGPDVGSLLQGLLTCDVQKNANYGFLLTPNGRFAFDVFIMPFEDGYLLDVNRKDDFMVQLKRYKLNRRVEIVDYPGYVGWSKDQPTSGVYYRDVRFYGYRMLLSKPSCVIDDYHYERIKNGISDAPLDLVPEKSIVLEHRLPSGTISFDKGCYVGQEFISRTHYLGVLRKRIDPYQIIEGEVQTGDELMHGGGQVLSVCKDVCLVRANETIFDKDEVMTVSQSRLRRIMV